MAHHEQFAGNLKDQVLLWAPQGHPQGISNVAFWQRVAHHSFIFCKVDSWNAFDSS